MHSSLQLFLYKIQMVLLCMYAYRCLSVKAYAENFKNKMIDKKKQSGGLDNNGTIIARAAGIVLLALVVYNAMVTYPQHAGPVAGIAIVAVVCSIIIDTFFQSRRFRPVAANKTNK